MELYVILCVCICRSVIVLIMEAFAAAQGGAISAGILYPLETIKKILQSQTKSEKKKKNKKKKKEENAQVTVVEETKELTFSSVVTNIYSERGCGGFFQGVEYAIVQSFIEKFVYFFAYVSYKGLYLKRKALSSKGENNKMRGNELNTLPNLIIGYLSELSHLPLTVPLEVIITRLITSRGKINSLNAAIKTIYSEKGILGFYKGFEAYFVTGFRSAIQYTIFEQLRSSVLKTINQARKVKNTGNGFSPVTSLTSRQAFLLGALSRAIATLIIFPFIRAKTLVMSNPSEEKNNTTDKSISQKEDTKEQANTFSHKSIIDTLKVLVKEEGPGALYKGMGTELLRGMLSSALMLMIKERLYAANSKQS